MKEEAIELTKTLLTGHFYESARVAAEKWLAVIGTAEESEAEAEYITMLKESVATLDEVTGFFSTPAAAEKFGSEMAKEILDHAAALKAAGEKYCDCPACSTALRTIKAFGVNLD